MATISTSTARRSLISGRRVGFALIAGAGLALAPLPAQAAAPPATSVAAAQVSAAPAATPAAQIAVDTALAQRGKPYVWGGNGPGSFDCSGLTSFAYRAAGIELPRVSRAQATVGVPVSRADLQPGDLVYFYSPVGHIGIYIGNGQMVHAPTRGDVVKVSGVDTMWGYAGARRVA